MQPLPLVAIVGRPNVGKSTLFNRIIRRRQAVVDDQPGVTRDRIYAHADWAGRRFRMVDTGGLLPDSKDPLEVAIRAQAEVAISEAAVVLFVADVETGATDLDLSVAGRLLRSGRPVVVAVNKVDNEQRAMEIHDFHRLGLGDPLPVSAMSGRGTGDLLDAVVAALPEPDPGEGPATLPVEEFDEQALLDAWDWEREARVTEDDEAGEAERSEQAGEPDEPLRVAVLGRPNVGKSSFVNEVVGVQRVIVSPQAGTTRDPADIEIEVSGRRIDLVDTAGLRRPSRVKEDVEYYSALRAIQSLDRADAALLMLDASEGPARQDARLLERILDRGKAAVLAVNKWDLVEKETGTAESYERALREQFPFAPYVPVIFISALTGQRVTRALEAVVAAGGARRRRVRTSTFNRFVSDTLHGEASITPAMGDLKVSYAVQAATGPPTFLFFVNDPKKVKPNFKRYLERQIRQAFDFEGTPIRIRFRAKA